MTTLSPSASDPTTPALRLPWTPRRLTLAGLSIGFVIASVWGLRRTGLSVVALIDGWPETRALLDRMLPPFIPEGDFGIIARAVIDTFLMAYAGTVIAVILAVPLSLCAARTTMPYAPVRAVARAIIVFTRALPSLILAMVLVRVYGIGVLPGILAIGIHAVGMIAKLLTDAAESIDPGTREGVQSTGAGPLQEIVTGVWSQMVPTAIATTLYRLEIDFRGATLLGFVGAGGVGLILRSYQGSLRYQELLGTTLIIVVLVIAVEALSATTRRAILGSPSVKGTAPATTTAAELHALSRSATPAATPTTAAASASATPMRLEARADVIADVSDRQISIASHDPTDQVEAAPLQLTPPLTKDRLKLGAATMGALILLILSFTVTGVSLRSFVLALPDLPPFFWRLVPKDMSWLTERVIADLIETVAIAFAATFLALLAAIPTAFLAASNTAPGRWVYRLTRLILLLLRALPDLIVAVLFVAAIGLGPAAGVLALTIGMFAFVTKLFADAIEEAAQGPRDGVASAGASGLQGISSGVLPQVLHSLVGNSLYLLDVSIRSSTILGIVGAGGIGFLLNNASRTLNFETVGGIVLCLFVIVYGIELIANWARRQLL